MQKQIIKKTVYIMAFLVIVCGVFIGGNLHMANSQNGEPEATCYNNIQDGNEEGVDCGVTCNVLCVNGAGEFLVADSSGGDMSAATRVDDEMYLITGAPTY